MASFNQFHNNCFRYTLSSQPQCLDCKKTPMKLLLSMQSSSAAAEVVAGVVVVVVVEAVVVVACLLVIIVLRWTGHVIRMEDQRIPKQLLFGELEQGHRRQGRPCKRFKDTVKAGLQWCDMPPTELVATALDRQRWRTLSQSASSALEEERRHQAQSARERRHLAACIPATNANFQCPDCKSRIGLQSHSRTHR